MERVCVCVCVGGGGLEEWSRLCISETLRANSR